MLVNLTPNKKEIERRAKIARENNFEFIPQHDPQWMQYGDGLYQSSFPFNFPQEEFLELGGKWDVVAQSLDLFAPDFKKSSYGVADSVEQIKSYYAEEIETKERKFFISMTPVYQDKNNKGKGGGWRWHKWGPYIGNLNPKCEYLDDEDFGDGFEYVIVFQIYEVL